MTKDQWNFIGGAFPGPPPIVVIDQDRVNLNDLLAMRPGSIIRVLDINAIKTFDEMKVEGRS